MHPNKNMFHQDMMYNLNHLHLSKYKVDNHSILFYLHLDMNRPNNYGMKTNLDKKMFHLDMMYIQNHLHLSKYQQDKVYIHFDFHLDNIHWNNYSN